MNIEELKEFMKTDEFKEIAKSLNWKAEDEVQGLVSKRDELLGKNKTLSQKIADLEAKLSEVDLDEYAELKSKAGSKSKDDNVAQLARDLEKLKKQLADEQTKAASIETEYNGALTKSALLEAFNKAGFDKKHHAILLDAFGNKAKVEVVDGKRNVIIGDDSVSDFFDKYAKGDGQHYVEQQESRGAGSQRMGGGGAKTMSDADFKKLPPAAQMEFATSGGKVI